jgi:hypothetical protein
MEPAAGFFIREVTMMKLRHDPDSDRLSLDGWGLIDNVIDDALGPALRAVLRPAIEEAVREAIEIAMDAEEGGLEVWMPALYMDEEQPQDPLTLEFNMLQFQPADMHSSPGKKPCQWVFQFGEMVRDHMHGYLGDGPEDDGAAGRAVIAALRLLADDLQTMTDDNAAR